MAVCSAPCATLVAERDTAAIVGALDKQPTHAHVAHFGEGDLFGAVHAMSANDQTGGLKPLGFRQLLLLSLASHPFFLAVKAGARIHIAHGAANAHPESVVQF